MKGEDYAITQVYLNWIGEYLSKQGVKDAEVWHVLQDALWAHHHPRLRRLGKKVARLRRLFLPFKAGR